MGGGGLAQALHRNVVARGLSWKLVEMPEIQLQIHNVVVRYGHYQEQGVQCTSCEKKALPSEILEPPSPPLSVCPTCPVLWGGRRTQVSPRCVDYVCAKL